MITVDKNQVLKATDISSYYQHGLSINPGATTQEVKDFLTLMDWLVEMVILFDRAQFRLKMNSRTKAMFALAIKRSGWYMENLDPEKPLLETYQGIPIEVDESVADNYTCGSSCNCTEIYLVCPTALHASQFNAKLVGIRAV
jgi:hypothetical protein